jgi:hypothetical protein
MEGSLYSYKKIGGDFYFFYHEGHKGKHKVTLRKIQGS